MSPLMYAAREGRATVVQKLIDKIAAINNQDTRGNSVSKGNSVGMYRLSIRYPVSAVYLTIRYYPDPVK